MSSLVYDLSYGFRVLVKSGRFSGLAVAILALGIGMTTAIFSVVYGVLLRPLDYERPDQLVQLHELNARGRAMQFADPNFDDVRAQSHAFQGMAEYAGIPTVVSGSSQPTRTTVALVSIDFFPLLRVKPLMGRSFASEDQRFGADAVVLVGYRYWKQDLGGTPDLAATKLIIDSRPVTVVGVLPANFAYPPDAEIWMPRELYERGFGRTGHSWHGLGRLRDGVSLAAASTDLQSIATRLKQQYGQDTMMVGVAIDPLRDALTQDVRPALWILLGAVGLLLLIACANVANLMLVQSVGRQHEIRIRLSIGGTRNRIVRQLVIEALLLSIAGDVVGVFTANWGLEALLAIAPDVLPRSAEVSLSFPVLIFSVALCLVMAVVLGVFLGFRSSAELQPALASAGRSRIGSGVSQRLSRAIVAGQLAITLTLLTGAALLGRSLLRVLSINPGFRTDHVVTMSLALPDGKGENAAVRRAQFLEEMLDRIGGIPGIVAVGGTGALPLIGYHPDGLYMLMNPGEPLPKDVPALLQMFHDTSRTGSADFVAASAGYFTALGIPLLRGRLFTSADTMNSPHVAVVSESVAREKWPGQDAIGRQIEFGNMDGDLRVLTVVGVVGDVHDEKLERPVSPVVYVDCLQRPKATSAFTVVIRASVDPATIVSTARQILRDLDPNVPPKFATMDEIVSGSVQARRFNLALVGVFAGTALLLAMAGLYSVMAYLVARRTAEIGVRMALGADRSTIIGLVLKNGLVTAVIGVVAGLVVSFAITRAISSLLFGLSPTDPLTFAGVSILLLAIALLACGVPARRATKVDPMVALRYT